MNETKLIEEFWRESEGQNFSNEATVLFFYLLYLGRRSKNYQKILLHPAALMCKVKDINVKTTLSASEELQKRGYIRFTPADGDYTSGTYAFVKGIDTKQPTK